jgi:hypothetical protein
MSTWADLILSKPVERTDENAPLLVRHDYLRRAAFAWLAIGGNDPEESIYVEAFTDSDGRTLSGTHDYHLHFDPGRTPPANAFWSLTMYDADRYLVENPIYRYAIRHRTPGLWYNSDGTWPRPAMNPTGFQPRPGNCPSHSVSTYLSPKR